jgi:putative component of membrane protein insertase Oxa1/YidC/SpoIIIJ protein YidD
MNTFEFDVDEKLRPTVERKLTGTTVMDSQISSLALPDSIHLKLTIALLRAYRKFAPKSIRCRCVFDPSCSHYSELAFRQHGIATGIKLTYSRLARCKPGAGGTDLLNVKHGA